MFLHIRGVFRQKHPMEMANDGVDIENDGTDFGNEGVFGTEKLRPLVPYRGANGFFGAFL